jgi:hypothetical protein
MLVSDSGNNSGISSGLGSNVNLYSIGATPIQNNFSSRIIRQISFVIYLQAKKVFLKYKAVGLLV